MGGAHAPVVGPRPASPELKPPRDANYICSSRRISLDYSRLYNTSLLAEGCACARAQVSHQESPTGLDKLSSGWRPTSSDQRSKSTSRE